MRVTVCSLIITRRRWKSGKTISDTYAEALEQFSKYCDTEKIIYSFKLGEEIPL